MQWKIEKVIVADVRYTEGMANYVVIHTRQKKCIPYLTFRGVEEQLPADLFIRIHKSYLTAFTAIQTIYGADMSLEGAVLPISKNYRADVMNMIEQRMFKR